MVVPILAGLGIADLEAIRVAALANNAPVSYGALGAPILALAAVTGLPMLQLSASVGHIVAVLALLPPWILIYLVTDWTGVKEAWPLAIVASSPTSPGSGRWRATWGRISRSERRDPFLLGDVLLQKSLAAKDGSRIWGKAPGPGKKPKPPIHHYSRARRYAHGCHMWCC